MTASVVATMVALMMIGIVVAVALLAFSDDQVAKTIGAKNGVVAGNLKPLLSQFSASSSSF